MFIDDRAQVLRCAECGGVMAAFWIRSFSPDTRYERLARWAMSKFACIDCLPETEMAAAKWGHQPGCSRYPKEEVRHDDADA